MLMPTQDERLTAVEQDLARFKTETIGRYQDFTIQFTVTKALAENTIGRLAMMHEEMNQRFAGVETTLSQHTAILDRHTTMLAEQKTLLTEILARLPEKP
jgi:hypothetical protein